MTRLAVNTPAAASDGPSLMTTARSGWPDALMPAATPAARNPAGAVTVMGRLRMAVRPAVSGRPSMRLAFWMAWPAAPLPRLSMAATTVARPVRGSAAACRCTPFDPATAAVVGQRPSGSRQTNGSSA